MTFFLTLIGAALAIPALCVALIAIRRNAAQWQPGELMEWPEESAS